MKRIIIDTETTGIDVTTCGLVQLAGMVEVNGKIVEEFNYRCHPMKDDTIEDKALEIQGRERAEVIAYPPPAQTYADFVQLLVRYVDRYDKADKLTWMGYHARFDVDIIRRFFKRHKDDYFGSYFWHPPICVMYLAAYVLQEERPRISKFNMVSVANHLNVKGHGSLHDALHDAKLTMLILAELERRLATKIETQIQLDRVGT